jgi:hypothetical protein
MFSSLSKRSNVPGMRSGFVAGDAATLKSFLLYRTYHGSAMNPAVQAASVAAWNDEAHVRRQPPPCTPKSSHGRHARLAHHLTPQCRTPASTCGRRRRSATASSPASCSPTIMSSFCPAATWRAPPRASIPAPASSASRSSRRSHDSASKPPNASVHSFVKL